MLEVGLVKLVEMKKLAPIEDILRKLGSGGTHAAAAAAGEEKKTLKSDNVRPIVAEAKVRQPEPEPEVSSFDETPPEESFPEPPSDDIGISDTIFEPAPVETIVPFEPRQYGGELILARIPSDLLEHFEDSRLDDAYEAALRFAGDDLRPLKSGGELAARLSDRGRSARSQAHSAGGGTAARPAVDLSHMIPKDRDIDTARPLPELSDAPTKEELMAYANALPSVRLAKQIFRGAEIVEVRKHEDQRNS